MDPIISPSQHFEKAAQNEQFGRALIPVDSTVAGWCVTVLFYAAVHYVQSVLVLRHYPTVLRHGQRSTLICQDPDLLAVWPEYKLLSAFAYKARYTLQPFREEDVEQAKTALTAIATLTARLLQPY